MVFKSRLYLVPVACLALQACGKKITTNDSNSNEVIKPELSSSEFKLQASIEANTVQTPDEQYNPKLGMMKIPKSIGVKEGNAGNYFAKATFNIDQWGDYEFYCLYRGGSGIPAPVEGTVEFEKGKSYKFVACYDYSHRELDLTEDDLENFTYPLDEDLKTRFSLNGAHPSLKTTADLVIQIQSYE